MKKITDELRKYLHDLDENRYKGWLSVNVEWNRVNKIFDAIEREFEERYIELPKDFNGEYIHIGEAMEDADGPLGCVWLIGPNDVMFDDHTVRWPHTLRKVRPDSWDRIWDDYVNLGNALTMAKEDVQSLLERAQKLGGQK